MYYLLRGMGASHDAKLAANRVGIFAHTIPLFHVTGQSFNRTPSDNLSMLRNLGVIRW
jgi:hypothetical protein